jgi:hypothetical protein
MKFLFIFIPEEFFWVMFTLILVGEFDYWKEPECKHLINKFDYVRVFLPTIVTAMLYNIFEYLGTNLLISQFIPPIVLYILISLTNDIWYDANALRWMSKTFIFVMLGFLAIGISKFIYVPFIVYATNLTIVDINSDFFLCFITSLPARIIQYSLLLYFVIRKRTLQKGKLFAPILSDTAHLLIFSVIVAFNIIFLCIMYKYIIYDRALLYIPHISQLLIIIIVILFPNMNIFTLVLISYYIIEKETTSRKLAAEKLQLLLKYTDTYSINEKSNVGWKLNALETGIEEVEDILYDSSGSEPYKTK